MLSRFFQTEDTESRTYTGEEHLGTFLPPRGRFSAPAPVRVPVPPILGRSGLHGLNAVGRHSYFTTVPPIDVLVR